MTMNGTTATSKKHDLYEVLQVSPRASADVIRAAYHVLARSYHPDVNPGPSAARQMRQLNIAYTVLGDPIKRAEYDAQGAEAARTTRERRAARPESRITELGVRQPEREGRAPRGRPRERAEVRAEPEARRAILTPVGRIAVAGLILTIAVVLCLGVWAVFEALDDGIGRVTPVSNAEPRFPPFSSERGPTGVSVPR